MSPGVVVRVKTAERFAGAAYGSLAVCHRPAVEEGGAATFLTADGDLVAVTWTDFFAGAAVVGFDEIAAEALSYLSLEALSKADRVKRYALCFAQPWPALANPA